MNEKSDLLVVGSNGFLGSTLVSQLGADAADRTQIDLTKTGHFKRGEIFARRYGHVAICAAATDVEFCFRNPGLSRQINVLGTIELLEKIKRIGAVPIFFSSDYVFSPKENPHREDDEKTPATVYGKQKFEVEKYIESSFEKFLIFRSSKLMSKTMHSKNILKPIVDSLKEKRPIRLFEDQWLNPVFIEDIAGVIKKSMEADLSGVFHLGTKQVLTRAELGRVVARYVGLAPELVQSSSMKDVLMSESRPNHNTLNCEKLEKTLDFRFTELAEGLETLYAI